MDFSNKIDDIYKNLQDFKQIPFASNYLISKIGIVYNKKTKKLFNSNVS